MKMVQLRNILLSVLVLAIVKADPSFQVDDNYVSLILEVSRFYQTPSIFFVTVRTTGDLEFTRILHGWIREFSRMEIMTVAIQISDMKRMSHYKHHLVRPLFVILLSDKESIKQFSEITKTFDMSTVYWFVIFLPGYDPVDYCPTPRGNPFNVLFNTEMLVYCPPDTILREWYSVNRNSTKIFELAKRESNGTLTFLTKLGLHDRRTDLEGLVVSAVVVMDSPYTKTNSEASATGLCVDVFNELAKNMNLSFKIGKMVRGHGRHNKKQNSWTGAVGELVDNRAEFALSYVSMASSRLDAVKFTIPFFLSSFRLYIKQPDVFSIGWYNYFRAFARKLWIAIIILILTSPVLLVCMRVVIGERNTALLISDCYFQIWGIICQQGLVEFPRKSSLRLAYISLFVSALVFSAAFSAALISFLTNVQHVLPFSSIEEFINDGSYKLIVLKDSIEYDIFANSQEPLAKKVMSLMREEENLPLTTMQGFHQICSGHKLALYASAELKHILGPQIPCNVAEIHIGHTDSVAMMWTKKSQYLRLMNHYILLFLMNGVMKRLKASYQKQTCPTKPGFSPVQVWGVIPILSFLGIGVVLSICVVIVEKFYFAEYKRESITKDKNKGRRSRKNDLFFRSQVPRR